MTKWRPDPATLTRPAYRSLVQAIETAIQNGVLKPGEQLPTQRQMAFDLSLSVQTVSRAYDKLTETGRIIGEVGRGTFVRAASDDISTPFVSRKAAGRLLDMSILKPVMDHAHEEAMQKTLRAMARSLPRVVMGGARNDVGTGGSSAARRWLALCGLDLTGMAVLPTNGSTSAMTVALMTATQPGDLIVSEEIGHHTLRPLARFLGLRLQGATVDDGGICPEALDHLCRREPVKAVYLIPNGANPLCFTMTQHRRAAVIEVARRHDLLIIENQAWGPLQDAPPPPIAALAPERVLYFTSLTKCLLSGLRVGYLVVPDHLSASAANRHMVTSWMATQLMTQIADRWIEDGTADALLTRQQLALRDRADFAANVFRGRDMRTSPNGLHIWLPCHDTQEETLQAQAIREVGVAVANGASFAIGPPDRHPGLRIAIGGQSFPEFARGIRMIDAALRHNNKH
ncbi:PLP-dependent aminotransferase family protein [Sulfitobacter delicatus]|nr:PLP-dependent aminotransferase family protein [Sulfitobacter delicatus]